MFTRIVAKTIVQTPDSKVLILRRSQTDERRPGDYDLPGGEVEQGEDVLMAAAREIKEETGISVNAFDMTVLHTSTTPEVHGATARVLCYVVAESSVDVLLSFEHDAYWWMTIDEAIMAFGKGPNWGTGIEFARVQGLLS